MRISDFQAGERIELIHDCRDLRYVAPIKAGTTGFLSKLYRVQDGKEYWSIVTEVGRICVTHLDIRRANVRLDS